MIISLRGKTAGNKPANTDISHVKMRYDSLVTGGKRL